MTDQKQYTIDDLPQFSPWPARLLGLEKFEQRSKNPDQVMREYEIEKWGAFLNRLKKSKKDGISVGLADVDSWLLGAEQSLCAVGDGFKLMTGSDSQKHYVDLVDKVLSSYFPASSLVELGAGYGSILLNLAQRPVFETARLIAGEYTQSGVDLIKTLAQSQGLSIEAGRCDFISPGITSLSIPQQAVIYTSYATPYIPFLPDSFVANLVRFKPKAVIHFEPCYEHYQGNQLVDMLRRRYIELNDYNRNLVDLLRSHEQKGYIQIMAEERVVFGSNALLPVSIIAWRPLAL